MNSAELAKMAYDIATKYETLYITGGQGQRLTDDNKKMFVTNYKSNREKRYDRIMNASTDTWAFDCNGLIKAIINGWTGDPDKPRGGAIYDKVIKDITCEQMIKECEDVSTDFSAVEIGELLYLPGHVGVCVSASPLLGVEATAKWTGEVLLSGINCNVSGYERRDWKSHGKMVNYIDYNNTINVKTILLKRGSVNSYVVALQTLLQKYNAGNIDGRFGPQTESAVKCFQRGHTDLSGRPLDVDGIVGALTWEALLKG